MTEPTQELSPTEPPFPAEQSAKSASTRTEVEQSDTDSLRIRLLEAARSASNIPDPFASITLAEIAAQIGKPESSILYQVEPRGDADALTVFRQRAYVRVVERVDTRIGRPAHEAMIAALAAGKPVHHVLATLCQLVALQFRLDPATPYLLGSRTRMRFNPYLADAVDKVWTELTTNLVDLIELAVAANRQQLDMERSDHVELARTAIAAGWMQTELIVSLDLADVEIDGATFEQTGLVLWTGIKDRLSEILTP